MESHYLINMDGNTAIIQYSIRTLVTSFLFQRTTRGKDARFLLYVIQEGA